MVDTRPIFLGTRPDPYMIKGRKKKKFPLHIIIIKEIIFTHVERVIPDMNRPKRASGYISYTV